MTASHPCLGDAYPSGDRFAPIPIKIEVLLIPDTFPPGEFMLIYDLYKFRNDSFKRPESLYKTQEKTDPNTNTKRYFETVTETNR